MTVKFKIEKGLTIQRNGEVWDREIYTLEWEVPELKDLENARSYAVKTIDGWLSGGVKAEAPPIQPEKKVVPTEDVRGLFPPDLEDMLEFEETEEYVKMRPRRYLGTENFAKIASIIRGAGGEYVSAGTDSHFRFEKKPSKTTKAEEVPAFDPEELMKHEGWKSKRMNGGYSKGSLAWGWEYAEKFSEATIEVLRKGPLTIGEYGFTLSENEKLVNTKKVK